MKKACSSSKILSFGKIFCLQLLNHLAILSKKNIDPFLPLYDNIIILGDFNSEMSEDAMGDFCDI